MKGTHLTGLEGTNPLGFFAALGVQVAFEGEEEVPKLWWSDDVVPHAIIDKRFSVERVVDQVTHVIPQLGISPAVRPVLYDQEYDDVKFPRDELRAYLAQSRNTLGDSLAFAIVAEGSYDKSNKAKPTDLYFAAGQQRFLKSIREILSAVDGTMIMNDLSGEWGYASEVTSLGWDIVDDRIYSLRSTNPTQDKKLANPGAESLAILGLSQFAAFGSSDRTLTLGCSGKWKNSAFTWPIWAKPSGIGSTHYLLRHSTHHDPRSVERSKWFQSWSVMFVCQSDIRRSDQGGYGTFGPPRIIWHSE